MDQAFQTQAYRLTGLDKRATLGVSGWLMAPAQRATAGGRRSEDGRAAADFPAPAPHAPEQVIVLAGAGAQKPAVRGDQIHGEQVVAREAVLSTDPADAATKREPRNAGGRDDPNSRREAKGLGLVIQLVEAVLAEPTGERGVPAPTERPQETPRAPSY